MDDRSGFAEFQAQLLRIRSPKVGVNFNPMEPIIIIDSDKAQCLNLREILESHQYATEVHPSLSDLVPDTKHEKNRVVILNLDSVSLDNRLIRDMKRKDASLQIIAISSKFFHPELEEAIRDYVHACLRQPFDPDELIYWIKSIHENDQSKERVSDGTRCPENHKTGFHK